MELYVLGGLLVGGCIGIATILIVTRSRVEVERKVMCGCALGVEKRGYALTNGGCGERLNMIDAYRCTGCSRWFHRGCLISKHRSEYNGDVKWT